jgi:hypothetical protein
MNLDTFGGRRFLLAMGSSITTTVLQYMGKIDAAGSTYALVVVGTVGSYIAGNVAERRSVSKKE